MKLEEVKIGAPLPVSYSARTVIFQKMWARLSRSALETSVALNPDGTVLTRSS